MRFALFFFVIVGFSLARASAQLTATKIFKPQNESIKSAVASKNKTIYVPELNPSMVPVLSPRQVQILDLKGTGANFKKDLALKVTELRNQTTQFKKQVQTTPTRAIAIANATNSTVNPKLLGLQTLNAKYSGKKAEANALLGPNPVCKAVGECQAPLDEKLSLSLSLSVQISATLSINNENMANNTLAGEIAGANNVTQNPINPSYNSNTVLYGPSDCSTRLITDFKTGHEDLGGSDQYSEWISAYMDRSACQSSEQYGATCSTICGRRLSKCDPCAMSKVVDAPSFGWAASQAGALSLAQICKTQWSTTSSALGSSWNNVTTPKSTFPGYFGTLCSPSPVDDDFPLATCVLPNYAAIGGDPCNIPTFTKTRLDATDVEVWSGALCYCTQTITP